AHGARDPLTAAFNRGQIEALAGNGNLLHAGNLRTPEPGTREPANPRTRERNRRTGNREPGTREPRDRENLVIATVRSAGGSPPQEADRCAGPAARRQPVER